MADNLESYFKKHLTEDQPAEENWNVPSDDVWNKVLPEIQKKRGLFIPWKYFYFLGIVLVAVLAFLLWPSGEEDINLENGQELVFEEPTQLPENENAKIDNSISKTTEEYTNTTDNLSITENKIEEDQTQNSNQSVTEKSIKNITTSELSANQEKAEQADESQPAKTVFRKNASENKTVAQNDNSVVTKSTTTFSLVADGQNNQISLLLKKSVDIIALTSPPTLLNKSSTLNFDAQLTYETKEPINNKGKFGVGAFYAPTFTNTSLSGETNKGFLETSNQFLYSGNWGFEINYFLSNRFTLVTGIGRSEIRSSSASLIEFPYSTANESSMPSGDKENTSSVPMQTPFGEINTEITFLVPGNVQFPDGEPMDSEMQTKQELRYLSIPLGVEFNAIRFSRFSWFIDAGIRYNRALKDATTFNSRILHEGDDMEVMYEQMTSHPTYTENYLSFYAGTGLNWQIAKSFQLKASANYFGNITKVNIQDNLSTYVNGFSLNFGIVYIF